MFQTFEDLFLEIVLNNYSKFKYNYKNKNISFISIKVGTNKIIFENHTQYEQIK